jgi:hypothetical protein
MAYSTKSCRFRKALSQYVTMGNVLSFDRTNPFSISAWVKTLNSGTSQFLVAKGGPPTPEGYWLLITGSGYPVFAMMNTYSTDDLRVRGGTAVNNGLWHHVCATHDGTGTAAGVKIYVDGVESTYTIESNNLTATIVNTASLRIGTRENGYPAECFDGNVDETAIYNKALSGAEVTEIYNLGATNNLSTLGSASNLVGWWRMGDSDTYPTLTDRGSGGNNGTMTNMAASDIQVNAPFSRGMLLDHIWRFKVNQVLATTGTNQGDNRQILLAIKNSLITAAGWTDSAGAAATLTTPWVVAASSNGTVADTNDNWNSTSDLVWGTGAHSWIILRQTGINGQNIEICIDLNTSQTFYGNIITSNGNGFNVSSPVTTARPTATDEYAHVSGLNYWFYNGTGSFSSVLNVEVSDDGQCTRVWGYIAGTIRSFWQFDKPKNTVAGWSNPSVICVIPIAEPLYTNLNDSPLGRIKALGLNGWCHYSTEFYVDGALGQKQTVVHSLTSEWPIGRIGLACITSGIYGRHGELSDVWFGATTPVNGDNYPASGTVKQFVQAGDLVLPWNQTTPVMT